jgi:PAS domain S-box-containing protein
MKNTFYDKINLRKTGARKKLLLFCFTALISSGIINLILLHLVLPGLSAEAVHNHMIGNAHGQFIFTAAGTTAISVLIVLSIAWLLSKKFTLPIKSMTDAMLEIAKGRWNTRIRIPDNDEFGKLAEGFNFMAEHIEDTMEQLKTSKDYTDNIVVSVPSILIVLSNRLNILSTNMAFEKLNEQYPSLSLNQFIAPLQEDIRSNLETGKIKRKELALIPEGSEASLIFAVIISRIGDNAGSDRIEKAGILLTITDITERRKMKELVLQSQQDWEDTFNTIPDMITIHDRDYNVILANNTAREALNIPQLDLSNTNTCREFYKGITSVHDAFKDCDTLKTGEPATFEMHETRLDKFIEIRSIPRFNNNNKLIGLIHIARDISLRKKIEDEHNKLLIAITKAKIEWEMTFDSVMEYIVLIDKDLKITRCNKSFTKYAQKPADDVVGHYCHEFYHCSPVQIHDCTKRMSGSCELLSKMELETEAGRWLYISHRPIQDDKEKLLNSVIIATDVTELKNAQQKIKVSEKELKKKVDDLEKFYDMAIGRELRMKELKKDIKRLSSQLTEYEELNIA